MGDTPPSLSEIDQLLEAGDLDSARSALAKCSPGDEACVVLRIKLGLRDGTIPAQAAMQKLVAMMRKNADIPGAQVLYQEASNSAYMSRESSLSHSHPPPPPEPKE